MGLIPIPTSPEHITADWMNEALHIGGGSPGVSVREVHVSQIGVGVGLVGGLYRCHVEYASEDPPGPKSVIIKMQSPDPKSVRIGRLFSLYKKEYDYYARIAPLCPLRSPKLYYGDFHKRTHAFALVLEDLQYMAVQSQIAGGTPEQARDGVRGAARLHSKFWQTGGIPNPLRYTSNFSPKFVLGVHTFCQAGLQSMIDLFGDEISPPVQRLVRAFSQDLTVYFQGVGAKERTLTHGDYRLDNMFFPNDDSEEVAVIDWQACAVGIGFWDISYFLSGSFTPEVRRQVEASVVEEYCETVCREGGARLDFTTGWHDYRANMINCFVIPIVVCAGLALENEDGSAELLRVGIRRLATALEDHDCFEFAPNRRSASASTLSMNYLANIAAAAVRRLNN